MKFIKKHIFKLALFVCLPSYIAATISVTFVAPFSVMAFDSSESVKSVWPWVLVISSFGLVISFFVADILILIFSLLKKRKFLIYSLLLPFPFIIVLMVLFANNW